MKKSAVTFAFVLFFSVFMTETSFGQVIKLKTTALAMKFKHDDNRWSDWSDWERTSVLIVADDNRITVYSKEKQVYDIIENEGKKTDSDGDDVWSYFCINEDGARCRLRLIKRNSRNGEAQLYVDFNDMKWVYNIELLET
ncbi:hypothetical protein [Cyclobacterium plantarum]|uniref:Uncharacterized protein n=1 Tax=Cyclobacterium plantarum TaxID=2716263 RepID=A0ABX0HAP4_9BACT|nr:hypothetical protein [Cyclobacterium plantarum]NHE58965.1 hypothetical protein [Cyclobacterium plantarum]